MPWSHPKSRPATPATIAAYLAHESLTREEAEVIGPREVAAWNVESAGWSPWEWHSWSDENGRGWPRVTYAGVIDRLTGDTSPWTIARSEGRLNVSPHATGETVTVPDMKAAMDFIRAHLVRPFATAA